MIEPNTSNSIIATWYVKTSKKIGRSTKHLKILSEAAVEPTKHDWLEVVQSALIPQHQSQVVHARQFLELRRW